MKIDHILGKSRKTIKVGLSGTISQTYSFEQNRNRPNRHNIYGDNKSCRHKKIFVIYVEVYKDEDHLHHKKSAS